MNTTEDKTQNNELTDKEKQIIKEFNEKLTKELKDIPPEFAKVLIENFWELI